MLGAGAIVGTNIGGDGACLEFEPLTNQGFMLVTFQVMSSILNFSLPKVIYLMQDTFENP